MKALCAIVQRHIDQYGMSEAEVARRIGAAPTTLNLWKRHGLRALPDKRPLEALAAVTNTPYVDVLDAALIDAGYLDKPRTSGQSQSVESLAEQVLSLSDTDLLHLSHFIQRVQIQRAAAPPIPRPTPCG